MFKFQPEKPTKTKKLVLPLSLDAKYDEHLSKASKQAGISKQELIRQMIKHCLSDLGYLSETQVERT